MRMRRTDMTASKSGIDLIAAERLRQICKEGWTPEHDEEHTDGELARAAAAYALHGLSPEGHEHAIRGLAVREFEDAWGETIGPRNHNLVIDGSFFFPRTWTPDWWKPKQYDPRKNSTKNRVRDLSKAGALIAAEIDRLLLQQEKK